MNSRTERPLYVFTLYISGMNMYSISALKNLKNLCDEYLSDQYEIKVIDLLTNPEKAAERDIIAVPTLVKELPLPVSRMIGDLSHKDQVLIKLDIK